MSELVARMSFGCSHTGCTSSKAQGRVQVLFFPPVCFASGSLANTVNSSSETAEAAHNVNSSMSEFSEPSLCKLRTAAVCSICSFANSDMLLSTVFADCASSEMLLTVNSSTLCKFPASNTRQCCRNKKTPKNENTREKNNQPPRDFDPSKVMPGILFFGPGVSWSLPSKPLTRQRLETHMLARPRLIAVQGDLPCQCCLQLASYTWNNTSIY